MSAHLSPRRWVGVAAAGVFSATVAAVFVASMLRATGGGWSLPLDDAFIYLQYARRAAEGHPLSYTEGAGVSTGATSWIHTLLLVPGWWLGFRGASFCMWAIGLSTLSLAALLLLVARVARSLAAGWVVPLAVFLVAASGAILWSAVSGMDTLLYAAYLLGILAIVAARGAKPGPAW